MKRLHPVSSHHLTIRKEAPSQSLAHLLQMTNVSHHSHSPLLSHKIDPLSYCHTSSLLLPPISVSLSIHDHTDTLSITTFFISPSNNNRRTLTSLYSAPPLPRRSQSILPHHPPTITEHSLHSTQPLFSLADRSRIFHTIHQQSPSTHFTLLSPSSPSPIAVDPSTPSTNNHRALTSLFSAPLLPRQSQSNLPHHPPTITEHSLHSSQPLFSLANRSRIFHTIHQQSPSTHFTLLSPSSPSPIAVDPSTPSTNNHRALTSLFSAPPLPRRSLSILPHHPAAPSHSSLPFLKISADTTITAHSQHVTRQLISSQHEPHREGCRPKFQTRHRLVSIAIHPQLAMQTPQQK
ncbi:hypothetical protein BLNAU_17048 [Blattamonas nauphoetae]|uniref:Uncharacterized protein n=1 Tax=Blattamonas nauphoetae TaxID=2049346 RepID=A0ABQ9XBI3_9EUKA|nr:hypothetical protein BLNAU_17048 [Blattamonas nauphoetae]